MDGRSMDGTVTIMSFEPLSFQFEEPFPAAAAAARVILPPLALRIDPAEEPVLTINIVSPTPLPACDIGEIITRNQRQFKAVYDAAREEYRKARRRSTIREARRIP